MKFALARKFINAIYLSNKKNKLLPLSLLIRIDLFSKKKKKTIIGQQILRDTIYSSDKEKRRGEKKKKY